jgi:uncharacterized membrane protein (UPF0182 family)
MYIREPRERVQKVAPFLELDSDPYPAAVDGRIVWIVDGYTTSSGYPYSQSTDFGDAVTDSQTRGVALQRRVNYIRNSVKATVDAYDGTVTLYEFGEPDPVLQTWNKAFGGDLVKPESEISDDLRAHLRYPEDLFKVQRELLARYHVEQPLEFFTREDFWEIPADPADAVNREASTAPVNAPVNAAPALDAAALTGPAQPPFYSLLDFPGEGGEQFRLSTSFTGLNRPNLSAFASVSSDPETYGQIQVLKLPRNNPPNGPGQVANQFLSEQVVADALFPFRQNRADVIFGNLLTLPAGQGLLYVQPVFVRAQGGESFPTLQRVLVSYGNEVAANTTLARSLADLFGAPPPRRGPDRPPADRTPERRRRPTTPAAVGAPRPHRGRPRRSATARTAAAARRLRGVGGRRTGSRAIARLAAGGGSTSTLAVALGLVEQLQQPLRRPGHHGPVAAHHDRPLDQVRVAASASSTSSPRAPSPRRLRRRAGARAGRRCRAASTASSSRAAAGCRGSAPSSA